MKYLIMTVSAFVLAACGNNSEADHSKMGHAEADASSHTDKVGTEKTGIEISSAYIVPPFPGRDVAGGFFKVTNYGADDRLISVTSPISASVEIHNHIEDNGVMKMRKVEGVPLANGETIEFKPGNFHLMMYGAAIPEGADTVSLTLNYETSAPVTLDVPVGEPKSDDMDHSKMKH